MGGHMGILALLFAFAFNSAHAAEVFYDTRTGATYDLEQFVYTRRAGSVLVFGEQHADASNEKDATVIQHHENQVRLLKTFASLPHPLRLGMEFLKYPSQQITDDYVDGRVLEHEFISQAWGSNPFAPYKQQLFIPRTTPAGRTLALNAPAELSRAVAKDGPYSLNAEQRALLPTLWERGSAEYFERFVDAMGGHGSPDALENYFWAQSLWDDTMAWKMKEGMNDYGYNVIIVGEFHTEYGHGLPARLRAHGVTDVETLLQVVVPNLSDEQIQNAITPDAKYGARADILWLQTPN